MFELNTNTRPVFLLKCEWSKMRKKTHTTNFKLKSTTDWDYERGNEFTYGCEFSMGKNMDFILNKNIHERLYV